MLNMREKVLSSRLRSAGAESTESDRVDEKDIFLSLGINVRYR